MPALKSSVLGITAALLMSLVELCKQAPHRAAGQDGSSPVASMSFPGTRGLCTERVRGLLMLTLTASLLAVRYRLGTPLGRSPSPIVTDTTNQGNQTQPCTFLASWVLHGCSGDTKKVLPCAQVGKRSSWRLPFPRKSWIHPSSGCNTLTEEDKSKTHRCDFLRCQQS